MDEVFINQIVPLVLSHTMDPHVRRDLRATSKKVRDRIDKYHKRLRLSVEPNAALLSNDPNRPVLVDIIKQRRIWMTILAAPFHLKTQLIYVNKMQQRRAGMTFALGNLFRIFSQANLHVEYAGVCQRAEEQFHTKYASLEAADADAIIVAAPGKVVIFENIAVSAATKDTLKEHLLQGTHCIVVGMVGEAEAGEGVEMIDWLQSHATLIIDPEIGVD